VNLLSEYESIVFFTGAGMSYESGAPAVGPIQRSGSHHQRLEDYASQASFDRDPEHAWDLHEKRLSAITSWVPHEGHRALGELQARRSGIHILTQNTDGLHQKAGATGVLELYGNFSRVRCERCGSRQPLAAGQRKHNCGNYWRPDLVWIGDDLPHPVLESALEAIRSCQLLVCIGTSGRLPPTDEFPLLARSCGAKLIEINPKKTHLSEIYDQALRGPASAMIPTLLG
jgi:NAD-dependent deacetylase